MLSMKSSMNGRNTRRTILDAAQRLIEKEGFVRLTTREIAREAGCAEGTLFKHFKRKEDLCLAVVLENSPTFKNAIADKHAGAGSVRKNLEEMALAAIRFSDKLIPMAAVLLADAKLLTRHRHVLTERGGGPKDVLDLIVTYISEEQRHGRISRDAEPPVVGALLLGTCFHRAFIRQVMGRNLVPVSDREFAIGLTATLMRGLLPR
jgi:AcrR family transcriptional regulator